MNPFNQNIQSVKRIMKRQSHLDKPVVTNSIQSSQQLSSRQSIVTKYQPNELIQTSFDIFKELLGNRIKMTTIKSIIDGEIITTDPKNIFVNENTFDDPKFNDKLKLCTKTLYDYQIDAIKMIRQLELTNERDVEVDHSKIKSNGWLLHLPIGSGKSLVFTFIAMMYRTVPHHDIIVSTSGKHIPDTEITQLKYYPFYYENIGYEVGNENAIICMRDYVQRQTTLIITHYHLMNQLKTYIETDFKKGLLKHTKINFVMSSRDIQLDSDIIIIPARVDLISEFVSLSYESPFMRVIVDDYTNMTNVDEYRQILASTTLFVSGSGFERDITKIPASYYTLRHVDVNKFSLVAPIESTIKGITRDTIATFNLIGSNTEFSSYKFTNDIDEQCLNTFNTVPGLLYPLIEKRGNRLIDYLSFSFLLKNINRFSYSINNVENDLRSNKLNPERVKYYLEWKSYQSEKMKVPSQDENGKIKTIEVDNPFYKLLTTKSINTSQSTEPLVQQECNICHKIFEHTSNGWGVVSTCCGSFFCSCCLKSMVTKNVIDSRTNQLYHDPSNCYCVICHQSNPSYIVNTSRCNKNTNVQSTSLVREFMNTDDLSNSCNFDFYFKMFLEGFKPKYFEGENIISELDDNQSTNQQIDSTKSTLESNQQIDSDKSTLELDLSDSVPKLYPKDKLSMTVFERIDSCLKKFDIKPYELNNETPCILIYDCPRFLEKRMNNYFINSFSKNRNSNLFNVDIVFKKDMSSLIGLHRNILAILVWNEPSNVDEIHQLIGRILRLNTWNNQIYYYITYENRFLYFCQRQLIIQMNSTLTKSRLESIYILNSTTIQLKDNLVCDLVFINSKLKEDDDKNKLNLLRINHISLEFLIVKLPGMSIDEFKSLLDGMINEIDVDNSTLNYKITTGRDSCCFSFDHKYIYGRIISDNINVLKQSHDILTRESIKYFQNLDKSTLSNFDYQLYKSSETPFRFTQNCLNVNNVKYYLSTKFNIPCIGQVVLNRKFIKSLDCSNETSMINFEWFDELYSTEFDNINSTFVTDESIQSIPVLTNDNVKVMSYDIETYIDQRSDKPHPSSLDEPIIAIGIGIFNINNPKPIRRICISSKPVKHIRHCRLEDSIDSDEIDLDDSDLDDDDLEYLCPNVEIDSDLQFDLTHQSTLEFSKSHEIDILKRFIELISDVKPLIITGFNNWSFDDVCIQSRLEHYKLFNSFLSSVNYYNCNDDYLNQRLSGKFKELNIKMDGGVVKDVKYHTWQNNFTTFHDCMIHSKKEDPKRFSERSRSNLDTMLEVYSIKSPFNHKCLSKTGLQIWTMMNYWKSNDNHKLDLILKYCCQDAWITGTFAISRNYFGDLIEMSNTTFTTLHDSLFKAVGIRVCNTITSYAYKEGFMLFDTPDQDSRFYQLQSPLGGKYFDRRTLIGGAVKNKRNGREFFIQAVDYSSMYPSQKEGSNVDTSSRVNKDVIEHPNEYNLELIDKYYLEDIYCGRWFYKFRSISNPKLIYDVEQMFSEFKLDHNRIEKLIIDYESHPNDNFIKSKLISEIYPLNLETTITQFHKNGIGSLPLTSFVDMYFVQSPKDSKSNLPLIHYSLKEKMLSDFRFKRSIVKKQLSQTKDQTKRIQLSSKEKAIKVVMNSEYGQTGSDVFGHFDSDIGGAVTFASRHCISECTSCLESNHFYVDDSFNDNSHLKKLIELGIVKYHTNVNYKPSFKNSFEGSQRSKNEIERIKSECFRQIDSTLDKCTLDRSECGIDSTLEFVRDSSDQTYTLIDFLLPPRRLTTHKLYWSLRNELNKLRSDSNQLLTDSTPNSSRDSNQHLTNDQFNNISRILSNHSLKVNVIELPSSQLIYQDTDSNYYTNEFIVSRYDQINPVTIESIMEDLYEHNLLLSDLIPSIIHRRPIGVGFEGAFVVARYLNKKKKYYGKKWIPGKMKSTLTINGIEFDYQHLPDDYEKFLDQQDSNGQFNTYFSLIPYKDGSYINVDNDSCRNSIDQLDYVMNNGIKCTGVDLARRDQFKFINYNNMLVFKYDLRYSTNGELSVDNFIKRFSTHSTLTRERFPLKNVIDDLLKRFDSSVKLILDNSTINLNQVPNWYPLEFFTKQKMLKHNCQTEMETIKNKIDRDQSSSFYQHLKQQLEDIKPKYGDRFSYLCIDPFNSENIIVENEKNSSMGYSIDHLRVILKSIDSRLESTSNQSTKIESTLERIESNESNESTIDNTDLRIFKSLDYFYYFTQLSSVLSNFVVIERDPSINSYIDGSFQIDHPELNQKQIKELMDKRIKQVKDELTREYLNQYYPNRHKIIENIDQQLKRLMKNNVKNKLENEFIQSQSVDDNINLMLTIEQRLKSEFKIRLLTFGEDDQTIMSNDFKLMVRNCPEQIVETINQHRQMITSKLRRDQFNHSLAGGSIQLISQLKLIYDQLQDEIMKTFLPNSIHMFMRVWLDRIVIRMNKPIKYYFKIQLSKRQFRISSQQLKMKLSNDQNVCGKIDPKYFILFDSQIQTCNISKPSDLIRFLQIHCSTFESMSSGFNLTGDSEIEFVKNLIELFKLDC